MCFFFFSSACCLTLLLTKFIFFVCGFRVLKVYKTAKFWNNRDGHMRLLREFLKIICLVWTLRPESVFFVVYYCCDQCQKWTYQSEWDRGCGKWGMREVWERNKTNSPSFIWWSLLLILYLHFYRTFKVAIFLLLQTFLHLPLSRSLAPSLTLLMIQVWIYLFLKSFYFAIIQKKNTIKSCVTHSLLKYYCSTIHNSF